MIRWDATGEGEGLDTRTCDACHQLNNTYYREDDLIPERPHPNCRCTLEVRRYIENPFPPYGHWLIRLWGEPPEWGEGPVDAITIADYLS